jgi:hypothetical protein
MDYNCKICNKKYASYKSLWNHNKKFHKEVCNASVNESLVFVNENQTIPSKNAQNVNVLSINSSMIENKTDAKYQCSKCKKIFNFRQGKWSHEKICKKEICIEKNDEKLKDEKIEKIEKENQEMKKEIEALKMLVQKSLKIHPKTLQKINNQLNNTNNGTLNNGTINNTINIIQLGKEDLTKMLSYEEKMNILNRQAMGINDLVKLVHTSGKYKKCMNVYITNLQNTIAYMYDEKENTFIAVNKNEMLNDLIDARMYDIHKFYEKLQIKFEPEKAARIKKFIDRMQNEKDCLKDLKKEEIKLILYNNREVISALLPKATV